MSDYKWVRIYYNKMVQSIAFYPALIAVGFLALSWGMLLFDFSSFGKEIKAGLSWLSLKDASTARTIISTVAGAIISLTVFSFSMVMIVLNQAASQMSNRVLTSMIENRFQQIILGIYIGTIVYALFLLSTIRDISSGVYVPAFSIYLLILLTVIDIFLFIYFLDYVTQTVKYETVINRVRDQTQRTMEKNFCEIDDRKPTWLNDDSASVPAQNSDYFQGFNEQKLLEFIRKNGVKVAFSVPKGDFLLKGSPCMKVYGAQKSNSDVLNAVADCADLYSGQPIDKNADYGFRQLAEIAIKALSPGINDPGTAVLALQALFALFHFRLYRQSPQVIKDKNDEILIFMPVNSFREVFQESFGPIWNYGKDDQYIQEALLAMLEQIKNQDHKNLYTDLWETWLLKIRMHQPKISA